MKDIIWQPRARRQLKKIKGAKTRADILAAVKTLREFPDVPEVKALVNHQYTHRLKVGTHRVLFNAFEEINIITIEEVKKRNERTY